MLRPADLRPVNVRSVRTAQKVRSRLPRLRSLADDLTHALPTLDQRLFHKLQDCALFLIVTDARHAARQAEEGATPSVLEQATKIRKVLIADAAALCARGYLKPSEVSKVKFLTGYESTSRDLDTLGAVLRRALPKIDGKSAVIINDVDQAPTSACNCGSCSSRVMSRPRVRQGRRTSGPRPFTLL